MSTVTNPIRTNERTWRFDEYEDNFRQHHSDVYADTGRSFEDDVLAYRFGFDMARDARFTGEAWKEVEADLRSEWEDANGSSWPKVEAAVRHSWQTTRDAIRQREAQNTERKMQGNPEPPEDHSPYRVHYDANYAHLGNPFTDYEPAYQYGYSFGTDIRYLRHEQWEEVSEKARERWEHDIEHKGTWDSFKDAVRHGWERAKGAVSSRDEYQEHFHEHYLQYDEDTPTPYEAYSPAYRYGAALAIDERYIRDEWRHVEPKARTQWEDSAFEGTWDDVREAVRFGWLQTRPVA